MSFLSTLALAVALLVVAPFLAHRLRRRRPDEQAFPPAHLVSPAPPRARRRSRVEDRALLAIRAAAVVLLALLGATPFVRCARLSLQRAGGASVAMAIVVDDSMSMRAPVGGRGPSRFERARRGARELLASAREGDAVAIVLAGAPARVALAATTDLALARSTIDSLSGSDRATDLDGALAMSRSLISPLPQVDRRIVVLSDLADGDPAGVPLGEGSSVPVWVALPELRAQATDCAIVRADRAGARVRVAVACGPGASATGREVVVEDAAGKVLARAAPAGGTHAETTVLLPTADVAAVRARLTGRDAVADDDVAPILAEEGRSAIAVVADASDEAVATGGAPIAEQALSALKLNVDVRPIPAFPDHPEDLAGRLGVLLDDPPGLTPEQRHTMATFLDGGGVVLVALGPRCAAEPLGASLEPVLGHAVTWSESTSTGADVASAIGDFAESARSLEDLSAPRRAVLAPDDVASFDPLVKWADGKLLVGRRGVGRGEAWIVTLPFSVDHSDLPLRPAFLALLEAWVHAARDRAAPTRSVVGSRWLFPGAHAVQALGPAGPMAATPDERGVLGLTPTLVGAYTITVDGKREARAAAPDVRELDLRPRSVASAALGRGLGEHRASVDISGQLALGLLALVAVEMALRAWSRRRADPAGS